MRKLRLSTIVEEILLLGASAVIAMPLYYLFIGAFKSRTEITRHPFLLTLEMVRNSGIRNFTYAIDTMSLVKSTIDTALITAAALVITVVLGSLMGFVIARVDRRLFRIIYAVLISVMIIPFIGCLIPLVVQSTRIGTYNTLWSCILIQGAWNLPFSVFLYTGFMRGLPKELEEAAYIDGCSLIGAYMRVFLPLLSPVTATCCIRSGVGIWNDFICCSSLLNTGKQPTLMVGIQAFFGARKSEYGYAFAGIILGSLPIILMFLFLQKYFIKGMSAGAVKG